VILEPHQKECEGSEPAKNGEVAARAAYLAETVFYYDTKTSTSSSKKIIHRPHFFATSKKIIHRPHFFATITIQLGLVVF
jgi:hypothetical protein